MALSFVARSGKGPRNGGLAGVRDTTDLPVLVTGAEGRIGSYFALHTNNRYRLRLMTRNKIEDTAPAQCGEVIQADLLDPETQPLGNPDRGVDLWSGRFNVNALN